MRNRSNDSNYHWDYQDYRGNYGQSPARARKSSGLKYFLIAMGVVILLVGALCVGASVWGSKPAPQPDQDSSIGNELEHLPEIDQQNKPEDNVPDTTEDGLLTPAGIYKKCAPSVVGIITYGSSSTAQGSGIILSENGYIITNAHVISGGKSCWIALDTGYPYDARLVGYDEEQDLAVLKAVDAEDLPVAEFGDSGQCRVGDTAYAIGNPLGVELRGTLTNGIISAINRDVQVEGRVMTLLQTTAALNNGNSGGPLINEYGQVIGINTLKMSGTGSEEEATVEGLGFALPSSDVCFVVNDLIATGRFRGIPTLGVTVTNSPDNGGQVVVYTVEDGYGAAEAGIQPGDVLLKADGQPLHQINDLMAVRRTHLVDDTMTLTVLRDGRVFDVEVPLYANKG